MKRFETLPAVDRAGAIAVATTAELVEWFNAHSGAAPIKKFADRKTAERRVLALLVEGVKAKKPEAKKPEAKKPEAKKPAQHKTVEHSSKEAADRSAAVADSWRDPEVAAARAVRDHVIVDGVWYVSVRQAFIDLNLPLAEHVSFRKKLKAAGAGKRYDMEWQITSKKEGEK